MPATENDQRTPLIVAIIPSQTPVTGGMVADLEILRQLRGLGWSIEVVALDAVPCPKYLPSLLLGFWLNAALLIRVVRMPPGVILLEDQALALYCLLLNVAARRLRDARVCLLAYHLVTGLWRNPLRRVAGRLLDRLGAETAHRILVSSTSTARQLRDLGVPGDRLFRITLGAGSQRRTDTAPHAVDNTGPLRLLTVGTVEPRKGLKFLLAALIDLRQLPWQLDVAGQIDPVHFHALARQVKDAELGDRVRFLGRVSDETLSQLMVDADIFVHPSLWEGFGLVLVEAMKYGLPIVATTAGSVPELLQNGHTGLLVPPGDAGALSRAVRELIVDSAFRRSLGRRAALHVAEKYTWEETGRQVDAALRGLRSTPGSSDSGRS